MPTRGNTSARYTVAKMVPAARRQVERPAALGDKPDRKPSAAVMMLYICVTRWAYLERVVLAAVSRELAPGISCSLRKNRPIFF